MAELPVLSEPSEDDLFVEQALRQRELLDQWQAAIDVWGKRIRLAGISIVALVAAVGVCFLTHRSGAWLWPFNFFTMYSFVGMFVAQHKNDKARARVLAAFKDRP